MVFVPEDVPVPLTVGFEPRKPDVDSCSTFHRRPEDQESTGVDPVEFPDFIEVYQPRFPDLRRPLRLASGPASKTELVVRARYSSRSRFPRGRNLEQLLPVRRSYEHLDAVVAVPALRRRRSARGILLGFLGARAPWGDRRHHNQRRHPARSPKPGAPALPVRFFHPARSLSGFDLRFRYSLRLSSSARAQLAQLQSLSVHPAARSIQWTIFGQMVRASPPITYMVRSP
jgi:hypothetical protein